jgi:sulfatase maturation enzyme AslB (radical SAM superfamily)
MGIMAEKTKSRFEQAVMVETPPFPNAMMLESTNACNLKCWFCYDKQHRNNTFLDMELAYKILTDAYAGGTREVCFNLKGEPLLHPRIVDLVGKAKQLGYTYIYNTTNGVLATKALVTRLVENGLNSLKFSINACNAEEYKKVHGADKFDVVMQNLRDAIQLRDQSKASGGGFYRVMVTYVYEGEIRDDMQKFENELEPFLDDFLFVEAINTNKRKDLDCKIPFCRLYVTAEGFLSLCLSDDFDKLLVADLHKMSILDAWNCELAREYRRKILAHKGLEGTLCGYCMGLSDEPVKPILNLQSV